MKLHGQKYSDLNLATLNKIRNHYHRDVFKGEINHRVTIGDQDAFLIEQTVGHRKYAILYVCDLQLNELKKDAGQQGWRMMRELLEKECSEPFASHAVICNGLIVCSDRHFQGWAKK